MGGIIDKIKDVVGGIVDTVKGVFNSVTGLFGPMNTGGGDFDNSIPDTGLLQTATGETAWVPKQYGERRAGMVLVANTVAKMNSATDYEIVNEDEDGAYAFNVYVLGEGPIAGLTQLNYFDNKVLTDRDNPIGFDTVFGEGDGIFRERFKENISIEIKSGELDQSLSTMLSQVRYSNGTKWFTSSDVGKGVAYLVVRLKRDREAFISQPSPTNFTWDGFGKLIKEIRLENSPRQFIGGGFHTATNPAMIALDQIRDTNFGAGIPDENIDFDSFVDFANFCDNPGTYIDGSAIPRFEINGQFNQGASLQNIINQINMSASVAIIDEGGIITAKIYKQEATTTGAAINGTNIIGNINRSEPSTTVAPNVCIVKYINIEGIETIEEITLNDTILANEKRKELQLDLRMVQGQAHARELAKRYLLELRQPTFEFGMDTTGYALGIYGVSSLTDVLNTNIFTEGTSMRIEGLRKQRIANEQRGAPITVNGRLYSDDIYTQLPNAIENTSTSTDAPGVNSIPQPINFTINQSADGEVIINCDYLSIYDMEVFYTNILDNKRTYINTISSVPTTVAVPQSGNYIISVRYIDSRYNRGPFATSPTTFINIEGAGVRSSTENQEFSLADQFGYTIFGDSVDGSNPRYSYNGVKELQTITNSGTHSNVFPTSHSTNTFYRLFLAKNATSALFQNPVKEVQHLNYYGTRSNYRAPIYETQGQLTFRFNPRRSIPPFADLTGNQYFIAPRSTSTFGTNFVNFNIRIFGKLIPISVQGGRNTLNIGGNDIRTALETEFPGVFTRTSATSTESTYSYDQSKYGFANYYFQTEQKIDSDSGVTVKGGSDFFTLDTFMMDEFLGTVKIGNESVSSTFTPQKDGALVINTYNTFVENESDTDIQSIITQMIQRFNGDGGRIYDFVNNVAESRIELTAITAGVISTQTYGVNVNNNNANVATAGNITFDNSVIVTPGTDTIDRLNPTMSFTPDPSGNTYTSSFINRSIADNLNSSQILDAFGTGAAALETAITKGTVDTTTDPNFNFIDMNMGTTSQLRPKFSIIRNDGKNLIFKSLAGPDVPGPKLETFTVIDPMGNNIGSFNSSTTASSVNNTIDVQTDTAEVINDSFESPINFRAYANTDTTTGSFNASSTISSSTTSYDERQNYNGYKDQLQDINRFTAEIKYDFSITTRTSPLFELQINGTFGSTQAVVTLGSPTLTATTTYEGSQLALLLYNDIKTKLFDGNTITIGTTVLTGYNIELTNDNTIILTVDSSDTISNFGFAVGHNEIPGGLFYIITNYRDAYPGTGALRTAIGYDPLFKEHLYSYVGDSGRGTMTLADASDFAKNGKVVVGDTDTAAGGFVGKVFYKDEESIYVAANTSTNTTDVLEIAANNVVIGNSTSIRNIEVVFGTSNIASFTNEDINTGKIIYAGSGILLSEDGNEHTYSSYNASTNQFISLSDFNNIRNKKAFQTIINLDNTEFINVGDEIRINGTNLGRRIYTYTNKNGNILEGVQPAPRNENSNNINQNDTADSIKVEAEVYAPIQGLWSIVSDKNDTTSTEGNLVFTSTETNEGNHTPTFYGVRSSDNTRVDPIDLESTKYVWTKINDTLRVPQYRLISARNIRYIFTNKIILNGYNILPGDNIIDLDNINNFEEVQGLPVYRPPGTPAPGSTLVYDSTNNRWVIAKNVASASDLPSSPVVGNTIIITTAFSSGGISFIVDNLYTFDGSSWILI